MNSQTAATADAFRQQADAGLNTLSQTAGVLCGGAKQAIDLHWAACQDQGASAVACVSALAKAEPAHLPNLLAEQGAQFFRTSFERTTRLVQDLWTLGQKVGQDLQKGVVAAA